MKAADFGVHSLPSLELCAMKGVAPDGFYVVEERLPLDPVSMSSQNDAESNGER